MKSPETTQPMIFGAHMNAMSNPKVDDVNTNEQLSMPELYRPPELVYSISEANSNGLTLNVIAMVRASDEDLYVKGRIANDMELRWNVSDQAANSLAEKLKIIAAYDARKTAESEAKRHEFIQRQERAAAAEQEALQQAALKATEATIAVLQEREARMQFELLEARSEASRLAVDAFMHNDLLAPFIDYKLKGKGETIEDMYRFAPETLLGRICLALSELDNPPVIPAKIEAEPIAKAPTTLLTSEAIMDAINRHAQSLETQERFPKPVRIGATVSVGEQVRFIPFERTP